MPSNWQGFKVTVKDKTYPQKGVSQNRAEKKNRRKFKIRIRIVTG